MVFKKSAVVFFHCFIFSLTLTLSGQFAEIGLNEPPGLRWKKIETTHFSIIFPESLTREAQSVAHRAEAIFDSLLGPSLQLAKRLTLVLSNQGVMDNGYFRLAPRMSEWYHRPTF